MTILVPEPPHEEADDTVLVTSVIDNQRVLLKPVPTPMPTSESIILLPLDDMPDNADAFETKYGYIWEDFAAGDIMALDFETTGVEPEAGDIVTVVGLSDSRGAISINVRDKPGILLRLLQRLAEHNIPMVAHNFTFDAAFAAKSLNAELIAQAGENGPAFHEWTHLRWEACTMLLSRMLSSEGPHQLKYGLKDLQIELLGWSVRGDVELSEWLIQNGYTKRGGGADKSQMSKAPFDILGYYCALDAASTYLLYTRVMRPVLNKFVGADMQIPYWMLHGLHCVVMQLNGVRIDRPKLEFINTHYARLAAQHLNEFVTQPVIAEAIAVFNARKIAEIENAEPSRKFKKALPLAAEPPKFLKALKKGEMQVSPRWLAWKQKESEILQAVPEYSAHWISWAERLAEAKATQHFSVTSSLHMRWLAYDYLQLPIKLTTESGQPSVDADALGQMGPLFRPLLAWAEYNKLVTTYTSSLLSKLTPADRLHPRLKFPGTNTGRLSGAGGINAQNQSKDIGYLDTWAANKGMSIIISDFAALEPVVLAEISRDKNLLKLYGPKALPHDVYLFFGCFTPMYKDRLAAEGYTPDFVTKEIVSACKKKFKQERQVLKLCVLSLQYGAGWRKIQASLRLSGTHLSDDEVITLVNAYKEMFSERYAYERQLQTQLFNNDRWILNATGRPVCIAADWEKDCISRCLAEGTLVVTDKGLLPIEQVTKEHLLWDGIEWVSHEGLVDNGRRDTIELAGVKLTPDHLVHTVLGWKLAQEVCNEQACLSNVGTATWAQVWRLFVSLFSSRKTW